MGIYKAAEFIIYEDTELIICHKPAGLAVQNAKAGTMDLESMLKNHLAECTPEKIPYLAVVHRLDQPVEGLLVFAKTPQAAKELSRQMTAGAFGKYYLAVTLHRPARPEGILQNYLIKDGKTNTSRVVSPDTPHAKSAVLSYRLLEEITDERFHGKIGYLLKIHLDTGRHHQIRVQLSHAGMPLLGDRKYNPTDSSPLPLALCAYRLEFRHPKTKRQIRFEVKPGGEAFTNRKRI